MMTISPPQLRSAQTAFEMMEPRSSRDHRGRAVATNIAVATRGSSWLRPAWRKWGTAEAVRRGTVILHSRADEVIPCRLRRSGQEQRIAGFGADRAWHKITGWPRRSRWRHAQGV